MENENTPFIEIRPNTYVDVVHVVALHLTEERNPKTGLEWFWYIDVGQEDSYRSRAFASEDSAREWGRNFREAVQRKRQEAP